MAVDDVQGRKRSNAVETSNIVRRITWKGLEEIRTVLVGGEGSEERICLNWREVLGWKVERCLKVLLRLFALMMS
jgi:hypothetical protein